MLTGILKRYALRTMMVSRSLMAMMHNVYIYILVVSVPIITLSPLRRAIQKYLEDYDFSYPMLLNINTHRKYWHSGAGQDGNEFDRYKNELKSLGDEGKKIDEENKLLIEKLWQQQLEIQ